MKIEKVGVVGCGLMGSGIAEVAAKAGFDVAVREVSDEFLEAGQGTIKKSLDRAVEKGKLEAADRDAAWSRIRFTTDLADLADRDLVVEAIVEDLDAKNELLSALDELCGADTIFASKHLFTADHGYGGRHESARQGGGPSLLQPGAGHEARGGRAHHRHE